MPIPLSRPSLSELFSLLLLAIFRFVIISLAISAFYIVALAIIKTKGCCFFTVIQGDAQIS
ncbi:hypothetical protein CPS_1719 [Colwellia psychrerythraea 34H]|uniref:Uncharacterized protein n=1 Tax=Colwellia psychrerythraea (strain 34H / ATCC BAA-681) TaxID=167879 RepID=Q484Q8_COLP3|nr:hypothetical protein CPS_1719 [Colwellia psychrerythraea 34H]